jgi:hypothetical protein
MSNRFHQTGLCPVKRARASYCKIVLIVIDRLLSQPQLRLSSTGPERALASNVVRTSRRESSSSNAGFSVSDCRAHSAYDATVAASRHIAGTAIHRLDSRTIRLDHRSLLLEFGTFFLSEPWSAFRAIPKCRSSFPQSCVLQSADQPWQLLRSKVCPPAWSFPP